MKSKIKKTPDAILSRPKIIAQARIQRRNETLVHWGLVTVFVVIFLFAIFTGDV